ncbi:Talin-1 [Danaus plexippus plexippus]|uniref:Talin-1 n=1 Tax=Danaus plexippus plexippus TaxID=278856 RepID=A0A212FBS7_DANPL|nr:Talin-1 [Danaus plexippus plexippus]
MATKMIIKTLQHKKQNSFSEERRPSTRPTSRGSIGLRPRSLIKMATLSLKISLEGGKVVKTIQFEPSTSVYDACRIIREKILEANDNDPKEYGLFLASEEDNKKGIWLEATRSLDYYMLRNGDLLEYNKKTRNLRVRMLDGEFRERKHSNTRNRTALVKKDVHPPDQRAEDP